jgi:hypothetical protein
MQTRYLVLALAVLAAPRLAYGQEQHMTHHEGIGIPEALQAEHHEIHERLVAATKLSGPVGDAARQLAAVLHPHFQREEQIALPPLGLLAPLARGEYSPDMVRVLPMTDSLRAELPRMIEEHVAIAAATERMGAAARAAKNAEVANLAETLALHARSEEEVSYPAALLVGEVVRMRAGLAPAGGSEP